MERVRELAHKGRKVVLLDLTGCAAGEAAKALVAGRRLIATLPPGSALTLTDVTGAHFDDAATAEAKTNAKENAPFVKAAALVGITGLKKIVYVAVTRMTGRDYRVFDTREQALDWLVEQ